MKILSPQLLYQIADGDEQAFRLLFEKYYSSVYNYAVKIIQSDFLAEEIVQEVFLKIWQSREMLSGIDNFGAYLRVVTRNHTLTLLRQVARDQARRVSFENTFIEANNGDEDINYRETAAIFNDAISHLPKQQKLVYTLYHVEGLKKDEVANQLNISPLTVKAHLRQAVQSVRNFVSMRLLSIIMLQLSCYFIGR